MDQDCQMYKTTGGRNSNYNCTDTWPSLFAPPEGRVLLSICLSVRMINRCSANITCLQIIGSVFYEQLISRRSDFCGFAGICLLWMLWMLGTYAISPHVGVSRVASSRTFLGVITSFRRLKTLYKQCRNNLRYASRTQNTITALRCFCKVSTGYPGLFLQRLARLVQHPKIIQELSTSIRELTLTSAPCVYKTTISQNATQH